MNSDNIELMNDLEGLKR